MPNNQNGNSGLGSAIPLLITCLVWIAVAWAGHIRYQPPEVISADDLSIRFSADRAEAVFERLYRDTGAHPAGENTWFRNKVIDEFRRLGYEVEIQHGTDRPRNRRSEQESIPLANLITSLVGKSDKPPIMLVAHYDSVPYGPGAGDDGAGLTALLEIARMLRDEAPLERTVVFLVTDGEEMGLLGARQFVNHHELANQIGVVINLEARGTTGPSLMFETSNDSSWLVDCFARTARKPFASSLFFEIYRFLPNSTDFTIFRLHGMRGFNFAFIGDVKNYHTPDDNYENLDRRSLQHHGENALRLIRTLSETDIEAQPQTRSVYFDVLGAFIVRWPAHLSLPISLLGWLAVFLFSFWHQRRVRSSPESRPRARFSIAISVLLVTIGVVATALFGKLLDLAFHFDNTLEVPFPEHPLPIQAAFWLFGLTVMAATTWLAGSRLDWRGSWFGVWFVWACVAATCSILIPGASYLFIAPLICTAIAIAMVIFVGSERSGPSAIFVSMVGGISVALIWMPNERLFYDALGFQMNVALILRVAVALSALLPLMTLCSRKALSIFLVGSLLVSAATTLWAVIAN